MTWSIFESSYWLKMRVYSQLAVYDAFTLRNLINMPEKRTIRIGLLGFGVVGQGVWKNIEKNRLALEYRLGTQLEITQVVVKDASKAREVLVPSGSYSEDPARVVDNPACLLYTSPSPRDNR